MLKMITTAKNVLNVFIFVQFGLHISDGACTFPTNLQNGTWQSSDMGDVTFNSTHFTVSQLLDFGSLTFECISINDNRYYSESESFSYLGISNPFKVSLCFELSELSSTKFIYYPQTSVLANTDVNRLYFNQAAHTFTSAETCDDQSTKMDHVRLLVKSGYANVSTEDCANAISGIYTYNVTGSTCSDTSLDVCTDKNEMIFNYTYCSDVMAYSAGGQLSCLYNKVEDGATYTILYNQDATTDETTYYRFTCLVADEQSDGTVYVTTYPRACLTSQNTTSIGSPGVAIVFSANTTCKTSSEDNAESTFSAGAAVAIVVALLILIGAAIVVGIWYYIKVHKMKKVNPDMIPAKSPPLDTKERNLDGRVSPFSPYPTVSELAVGRFGPSEIDDDDGGMTLEATTPGFTDGRRTMYGKDAERESQASLPVYSEVGGDTPEPTRLSEVHTRMSEISEVNIADPTPFTMTRATMNIPEETRVSPLQTPENRPNGAVTSPRENGDVNDVTL